MYDRFNAWVGSLYLRSDDLNLKRDEGQTFVEYALVLSVVVIGLLLLATWTGLRDAIDTAIDKVTAKLTAP
jgi:Flp pilus assembly pilin Flp